MAELTFLFIASSVCIFSVLAVIARDIFHCAVWLAMTLLSVAGVYFYLDAEFLGVTQVLVYVGGIMTLFVFAIKLTARIGDSAIRQTNEQFIPSAIAIFIIYCFLLKIIVSNPWAPVQPEATILSLKELGKSLITNYLLPFEFISLLLLAVLVGAIVIGRVKK